MPVRCEGSIRLSRNSLLRPTAVPNKRRLPVRPSNCLDVPTYVSTRKIHGTPRYHDRQAPTASQQLLRILEERSLLSAIAGPRDGLERLLGSKAVGAYCGVDPTAKSMHIGNLLPLMVLFWLYRFGHRAFTLVGGGTAKIGDPSFRETARDNKSSLEHDDNSQKIKRQMIDLWRRIESLPADADAQDKHDGRGQWTQFDNSTWLDGLTFLDIMSTMGKGIRVSDLLSKESMKTRLWAGQDKDMKGGLSLSELNYAALQAWDFWQLYRQHDVQLQIGGGDQYGNITTGVDAVQHMIRGVTGPRSEADQLKRSYGLTTSLVTIGSKKMGKSEGNALFLSPEVTSDFELYQYFLRLPDSDVEAFFRMYTFTPIPDIMKTMEEHNKAPEKRTAHHALAHDFVTIHRGRDVADEARKQHATLFMLRSRQSGTGQSQEIVGNGGTGSMPRAQIANLPSVPYPATLAFGSSISDILVDVGMCQSKSEVNRMLSKQGGLYYGLDFSPVSNRDIRFKPSSPIPAVKPSEEGERLAEGNLLVLRRGKWKVKVLQVVADEEYETQDKGIWTPGWKEHRKQHATAS